MIRGMKKKTKRIIVSAAVVVAVAAGLLIYSAVSANAQQSAALDTQYGTDTATKGSISLTVSGSGNLASAKTLSVNADSHLDISDVLVSEGDVIEEGQPIATLDTAAMQSYADDLKTQIASLHTQIDTTNNVTTKLTIKSPASGWIKSIKLDEDDGTTGS